ncbi:unnamed protein product [Symbiodinium microadriaticum]|nr:unnamed protein product [Symbiodinium microadriaticum]CAE7942073.1 unnamed protein product [Symbiodinium sp. KB8]
MVTAAGGDSRLEQILRTRLLRSEGAENNHCFTKEPSRGSADAGCKPASLSPQDKTPEDAGVGKLFCMHSGDTPPPSPRADDHFPSPGDMAKTGSEDEAESTDGMPDSQAGDGELSHYDWQFELMNSMPREKALELARVLKRSEKEKVLESVKLRQEVVELKRQVSRTSSSSAKTRCMLLLSTLVALVAVAFAMDVIPWQQVWASIDQKVPHDEVQHGIATTETRPAPEQESHENATAVPKDVPEQAWANQSEPDASDSGTSSTATTTAVAAAHTTLEPAAPGLEPAVPTTPPAAAAPAQPVSRQVPLWAAEVSTGSCRVELWHKALSQDLAATGMIEADLGKAMAFFPKVTKTFRFVQIFVTRSLLNNKQVALQANLNLANVGAAAWPPTTRLRLIHGAGMGLWGLELGQAVMPGAHVELALQLEVPKRGEGDGNDFARHVWVLADSNNEPFGPLLVAEVAWLP